MGPGFDSAYPSWYVGTFLIYVSNLNFLCSVLQFANVVSVKDCTRTIHVYCNLLMLTLMINSIMV